MREQRISNILAETLPSEHEILARAQPDASTNVSSGSLSSLSDLNTYDHQGVIDLTDYEPKERKTEHEYVGLVEDADEAYSELVQTSTNPITQMTYKLFGVNRAVYW